MKRVICIVILMLTAANLFAQGKPLKKYYYWINQAELAICDSNFQTASDCYDKAFSYHRPFGKDASYAFTVNHYYTNNINRCLDCFKYLAQQGDKAEWYVEDTIQEADLWEHLKIISDTTKSLVNPALAAALTEIYESDQAIRWLEFENEDAAFAAYREVDSVNLLKIRELYKTFPEISDYTADGSPLRLSTFYIHVSRAFLFDPKTILLNDVRRGNIPADQYIRMEDEWRCFYIDPQLGKENTTIYGTNPDYFFTVDSIAFFLEPDNIKIINQERRKLGLSETWADFITKAKYTYTHDTEFHFIPRYSWRYSPEEAAHEIAKWKNAIQNSERKGFYFIIPKELRQ